MKWNNLQKMTEVQFRRITGIKRSTFDKMIEILIIAEKNQKIKGGRPNSLCIENRLLMALEYLREYRTYAHIGASYGLSESNAFKNIKWIENIIVKSKEFSLPGKKALLDNDHEFEVILVDVTESPIERPKKNKEVIIRERKKDIR